MTRAGEPAVTLPMNLSRSNAKRHIKKNLFNLMSAAIFSLIVGAFVVCALLDSVSAHIILNMHTKNVQALALVISPAHPHGCLKLKSNTRLHLRREKKKPFMWTIQTTGRHNKAVHGGK